jgi:hypothetical protein
MVSLLLCTTNNRGQVHRQKDSKLLYLLGMIRNGEQEERVDAVQELVKECSRSLPAREVCVASVACGVLESTCSYHRGSP